jgi:hypothetical protein
VAKATNEVKQANESRADAALSPRFTPASARQEAGISAIPYSYWYGRFTKLPAELQQVFMPLLQPHLEALQRGEILRAVSFVPKVGAITLQLKNGEIWASFMDALQWACLILKHFRVRAFALRCRTFARSPEGGMWVWLPQQLVFPPDCRLTLLCAEYQANFLEKSPPLWWQPTVRRLETTDEAQSQKKTSHWLTPSVPRALRAPNFCAAHRGGSGRLGSRLEPLTG